nr:MAG TPA: hypothetical protein [Crassvirales sp.]
MNCSNCIINMLPYSITRNPIHTSFSWCSI